MEMDIVLPTVLHYILKKSLNKVSDKLDTEFRINLQKYRQFSECSTEKIIEEVYNDITTTTQQACFYMHFRVFIRLK